MINGRQIELRDGEALDILADVWRRAGEDGEVNGGDLVELVGGLLKETGRPLVFTVATRRNMQEFRKRYEDAGQHGAPLAICVSLNGPERYSGTPGDYTWERDDEPIKDEDHEPMILAVETIHGLRDALTGAPIHVEHP